MKFLIYQDNGGQFHWCLVDGDGASLAVSAATFGSAKEARRAAEHVRAHAGSAHSAKD